MDTAYYNEIKPEYENNRDRLKDSFPDAYNFIFWLEELENKGYHLGTDINLHFYFNNSFLFRFEFISPNQIDIIQNKRGMIKDGTIERGEVFYKYWFSHIEREFSNKIKYSKRIVITRNAESALIFKTLKNAIKNIPIELERLKLL